MPELRLLINLQLTPSYDPILKPLKAPGLAEFFDPAYEIPTKSKEKLNRLFNIMPNGSIGIAGPRGAGKTTLLLSFCRPSEKKIKCFEVLSVMTSAPIEYMARDFILHVFALVCKRVLTLKGKSPPSPWRYINPLQKPSLNPFVFFLNFLRRPIFIVILFAIGLFLIFSSQYISKLYDALISQGFEPGGFKLGIFFIGLSLLWLFWLGFFLPQYYRVKEHLEHRYSTEISPRYNRDSSSEIVKEAQEWLRIIRFQSSYSSGWSGSLKIPIAEVGVNTATSLSEKQLSLPEIIDSYQRFIERIAQEYLVIIGIDELDKLPTDEQARRFLNEIKGIFGLENCFYLVSVSESAMSSFSRRGLPFRDVFDSSFDDIIYVNYLSLEEAKTLIKRRVIGMPIPFVSFCYCLCGGLARDLIRTCRNLLELVQLTPENNSLPTLCSSLIRIEIKSKLHAVSVAAKDINLEPESTELLEEINQIETSSISPPSLLKCCSDLLHDATTISAQQHVSEEVLSKRNKLASLREELGAYLYFVITILEFFNEDMDVKTFKEDEGSKALEQLAKACQFLAISPRIANSIIIEFRKSQEMDLFQA